MSTPLTSRWATPKAPSATGAKASSDTPAPNPPVTSTPKPSAAVSTPLRSKPAPAPQTSRPAPLGSTAPPLVSRWANLEAPKPEPLLQPSKVERERTLERAAAAPRRGSAAKQGDLFQAKLNQSEARAKESSQRRKSDARRKSRTKSNSSDEDFRPSMTPGALSLASRLAMGAKAVAETKPASHDSGKDKNRRSNRRDGHDHSHQPNHEALAAPTKRGPYASAPGSAAGPGLGSNTASRGAGAQSAPASRGAASRAPGAKRDATRSRQGVAIANEGRVLTTEEMDKLVSGVKNMDWADLMDDDDF